MTIATDFKLVRTLRTGRTIKECKTRSQGSKTRSRGYILNLQTAVNNSKRAKATVCLFSMYTDCKEKKTSKRK